jgi:uncharacterized protein (TIGR00730 family)
MMKLTLKEHEKSSQERISIIKKEFEAGFKFLETHQRSVTVFGSSRFKEGNSYYEHARVLGRKIAEELKYAVLTGGGPGIMEAANRGAYEAGGSSLGLTINMPQEQATNNYLTEQIDFYYFFSRKVCLSFSAEAYVFYPGGFGTLDEFFEILTLVQTGKISRVPIILAGKFYWQEFDSIIRKILAEKFDTIEDKDTRLYTITDDHQEIVEIIKKAPIREGLK